MKDYHVGRHILDILSTTLYFTLALVWAKDGGIFDYITAAILILNGLLIFSHSLFLYIKEKLALENYATNDPTVTNNNGE